VVLKPDANQEMVLKRGHQEGSFYFTCLSFNFNPVLSHDLVTPHLFFIKLSLKSKKFWRVDGCVGLCFMWGRRISLVVIFMCACMCVCTCVCVYACIYLFYCCAGNTLCHL
jgi:hypothetical protein